MQRIKNTNGNIGYTYVHKYLGTYLPNKIKKHTLPASYTCQ